jgi:hypothetical protein
VVLLVFGVGRENTGLKVSSNCTRSSIEHSAILSHAFLPCILCVGLALGLFKQEIARFCQENTSVGLIVQQAVLNISILALDVADRVKKRYVPNDRALNFFLLVEKFTSQTSSA